MASNAIHTIPYRRKRQGKTNYKKRLDLLKGNKHRLVVRKSNSSIQLQLIDYLPDGDKVIATFNSLSLSKKGWDYSCNSIPASYVAGLELGAIAVKKNISEAIVDLGLQLPKKGGRLYAAIKGVIDAGVSIPISEEVFPSEDRLFGKHIASWDALSEIATGYKKKNLSHKDIPNKVQELKKALVGDGE
ncbi:MAG: 50S ribosomal protein L18 [Candidatus Nanoarchaeia archaeon]